MLLRRLNVTRFYVHIVTILTKKHSIGYSIQKLRVNSLIFGDSGGIFALARKSNFWRFPRVASPRNSARACVYLTHPTFAIAKIRDYPQSTTSTVRLAVDYYLYNAMLIQMPLLLDLPM